MDEQQKQQQKQQQSSSPPLAVNSTDRINEVKQIKRASLQLSPPWDNERQSLQHLGDLDDDDVIKIAYFPLGKGTLLKQPNEVLPGDGPSKETIITVTTDTGGDDPNDVVVGDDDDTGDDEWSVASITDSIYSYNTVSGIWADVPMGPPDAILGIAQAFRQCDDPRKVNVCVGAYRDDNGKPYILPTVRKAEKILWDDCEPKEYLPIEGDKEFISHAMKFAYGTGMDIDDHVAAVQTLSGTGACTIGGKFLSQFWPDHPIYVPNPTWGNHIAIFKACGLDCRKYRYYNRQTNGLDVDGMIKDLQRAPDGSIILLHACAHNPTGCDPTLEEWKYVISIISSKQHIAFFDSAYQGFASGNAEQDAQAFRYAVSQHVPILLAQSFAKNFGLYGERVGTLSVVCGDASQKERIMSELRCIVRPMYSSPPRHGSSIVKTVLGNPSLKEEYYKECASMAIRIHKMRKKLVQALKDTGSAHDWSHIIQQIGMFAYTGLTEEMCKRLTQEYSIFLTTNGRISMAGLNDSNLQYVANAIHMVSDGQSISG